LADAAIDHVMVVIGLGDDARYAHAVADLPTGKLLSPVQGGTTRQDSVRLGLQALAATGFDGIVLVHDAARPFVTAALMRRAVDALQSEIAAIPALPVTDTIKRLGSDGRVAETPPRDTLVSVQTPQGFHFQALLAAHEAAVAAGLSGFTDDAALMEWAGHPVKPFPETQPT
jgi:2-C-methyl-D-erythritol 4-phosphate cytidylyltransferase/2-C-methyl-D-erythritol 2,4-cyclodiphosphate synthase